MNISECFVVVYLMTAHMQGILVDRLASALWPEYLDNKSVVLSLLEQLDVIVRQSARLSCSVSVLCLLILLKSLRVYLANFSSL